MATLARGGSERALGSASKLASGQLDTSISLANAELIFWLWRPLMHIRRQADFWETIYTS